MKWIKLLSVMGGLMIVFWLSGNALAFHDGGVAECSGCHSMHNWDPATRTVGQADGYEHLLGASTPSDVCLNCHASVGQFDGGLGYGAGGDFYWLTQTWTWTAHGSEHNSYGYRHGHSISAPDHGIINDAELNIYAPGSETAPARYETAWLGCNSCHDPHGSQNNELLLYGVELTPNNYQFVNKAPIFEGAGRRSASSNAVSDTYASAYGNGMSEWCANCHPDIHNPASSSNRHVTGVVINSLADNYNSYVMGVQPYTVGGNDLTTVNTEGFSELVQFERNRVVTEDDRVDPIGPDSNSIVMCLTCHRAHATAFDNSTRWDMNTTFLAESHPDGGATDNSTPADQMNSYYGRQWLFDPATDTGQRSLCNKCHQKDGNPLAGVL